ncbi:MAG: hypothetical protein Tsb0015_00380 [Simkaniaceae bacterium]
MADTPQQVKKQLRADILDLQRRLEELLVTYKEIQEASLEEKDRLNIVINEELKLMDRDITDLDEKGSLLSKKVQILTGQIIFSFEEFSHAITETPNSVEELMKNLYKLLENLLSEIQEETYL